MESLPTKSALVTDDIVLRTATEEAEIDHLRQILNQGHYLQAGRPAGHVLWQGIYRTDAETGCPGLVAVLCWGGAAKRLKERDNHIGWDSVTCANRLKLVVQLRRFYVIDSARQPNLASQCLALSLRTLGSEFEARHGFQPLLAESFHDPEEHTGTLYKATNWQPLGFTKGFKRHRRDFYQDTGKPKHLWIRPLKKDALSLLARPGLLPPAHQAAIAGGDTAGARCALKCPELLTLRQALRGLTDTRNPKAIRHPFSAMLALIVYGLICGANDVKAIWQKCAPLDQNQRRAIGLTRRNKKTGLLTMPGYGALNDIVNRIDPVELARALNAWLTENSELLPKTLAIDGKTIGAKGRLGGIVTLCFHATGQPLARAHLQRQKRRLRTARRPTPPRQGCCRTTRRIPGHRRRAQYPKKTASIITGHGGDYLLGLKDNQPTLHELAQKSFRDLADEWVSDWEKDHGRIERRRLSRVDLDWEISPFPGARQLVKSTREWMEATSDELKSETRYFITSLEREERSAARLAQAIRGHWSVENKNHWKRDNCLWKEDASRPRKKASGGQVLALLRGAVLRLHDTEIFQTLNASFHHHTAKPHAALRLLKTPPPKIN